MKTSRLLVLSAIFTVSTFGMQNTFAKSRSVVCTPRTVATYTKRIHVRCTQTFSGIRYFAYRTSDKAGAARFMSMATSALISGRNVRVYYNPADKSGKKIGCQVKDCRLMWGLEIM